MNSSSKESDSWWNTEWSYRQEIMIPSEINRTLNDLQPIDIIIRFESPCWVKNETTHSIRVIKQHQRDNIELESQIYDLDYEKDTILRSCNVVFIIPENMTGTEVFYVYYDESSTVPPMYVDHVSILDSSYYYEPISGYPLSSRFYHIIEDGSSVYAICQEGTFMDFYTAQSITKLTANTTTVKPENGQAIASYDYSFFYGDTMQDSYTTSKSLVSKHINIDGNLLVSCTIKSSSSTDDMFSTVTYNYYYCSTAEKRIFSSVCHEIKNEYVTSAKVLTDGIYATLLTASVKSAAIEQLNFGTIPPYIHYRNEHNEFKEYPIDPNPSYISTGECLPIISKEHDQDLSDDAWVCFDDGTTGAAYAILFNTTQVIVSGENERNGVQIKAYEIDSIHLPGFENNMAVILLGRNSYETQEGSDIHTPKDFIIRFNAEFYYTPTGGYPQVVKESERYQSLSLLRHQKNNDQTYTYETEKTYNLTVFVHNAFTFPQAQALSLASGLNLSFIQVQIYQNDTLICSGSPSRIHVKSIAETKDADLPLILQMMKLGDWKKTTVFKSIHFENITIGTYVVKIVRYHPLIHKTPQYIGVDTITVQDDTEIHVTCTREKQVSVSVIDQFLQPVQDVFVQIIIDNQSVSSNVTDLSGSTILHFPAHVLRSYQIIGLYKGFLISNETLTLRDSIRVKTLKIQMQVERYNLDLIFKDSWHLLSALNIYPILTCDQQDIPISFPAHQIAQAHYSFNDLPKAMYTLTHPSTSEDVLIYLNCNHTETIILPDTYPISYHLFNKRGIPMDHLIITVHRENKSFIYDADKQHGSFYLPAGTYFLNVTQKEQQVCTLFLHVYSEISVDIVTTVDPFDSSIIILIFVMIFAISILHFIRQKTYRFLLVAILFSLLLASFLNPWWMIAGDNNGTYMQTSLFLFPPNLITFYMNETIHTGELAGLPSIFNLAFTGFISMFVGGSCLLCIWQCFPGTMSFLKSKRILILLISTLMISIGFIGSTVLIHVLSNVAIGSFFGSGPLDVMVPGATQSQIILCLWGPSYGWYGGIIICILAWIVLYDKRKPTLRKQDDKERRT